MIQAKLFFTDPGEGDSSSIPVGIHAGVSFNGLTRDQDWWDILFANDKGQTLHKRLFRPDGNFPREAETPAEALSRQIEDNLRNVVKLCRVILGDGVTNQIEAPDYDNFVEIASELLNERKGERINLKVIPGRPSKKHEGRRFPAVPDYTPWAPYIEVYTEGAAPTLKYSKYEQKLVDEYLSIESATDSGPETPAPQASPGDELPF